MRKFSYAVLFVLVASLSTSGKEKPRNWERAKVISQNLHSSPSGAYAAPLGNGAIAVPIYRTSNVVVVETGHFQYQWFEVGQRKIVLPVNSEIEFYREADWFVVLDNKNKQHKFGLVGATVIDGTSSGTQVASEEHRKPRIGDLDHTIARHE